MLAANLLWEVLKRNEKLEGEGKVENVQSYSRCTSDISPAYGEKWMSTVMERVEMVSLWKAAYEEWDQGKAGLLIDKCEEKYSAEALIWGTREKQLPCDPLLHPYPAPLNPTGTWHRDGKLTITMMKSSQHQALVKYFPNPRATHFRPISKIKMYVKTVSVQLSNSWILGCLSRLISSNTWNDKAQP